MENIVKIYNHIYKRYGSVCRYTVVKVERTSHMTRTEKGQSVSDRQPRGTWWCVATPNTNTLLLVGVDTTILCYYFIKKLHLMFEISVSISFL